MAFNLLTTRGLSHNSVGGNASELEWLGCVSQEKEEVYPWLLSRVSERIEWQVGFW
jgi:hypothetical protein